MRRRALLVIAVFSSLMLPLSAAATTVQNVVNQVSQTQYANFLDNSLYTHIGDNRGLGGAQHDLARTNIYNGFQGLGLNPVLEPFTYNSSTYYNVVATLPGRVHPNQIYIVGAHFDSRSNPGADDNASGVAGVVEAARVLSQYQFDATLKFIAFDREEQGLVGSYSYANAHSGDDIQGMIQLDLIAFNSVNPLHHDKAWVDYASGNSNSLTVSQDLANAVSTYGGIAVSMGQMGTSDHVPFATWGSALLIEHAMTTSGFYNPYYHTASDAVGSTYSYGGQTYNYIDYGYATDMTRGAVGYLATEARLVPEPAAFVMLIAGAISFAAYAWRRLGGQRKGEVGRRRND